MTIASPVTTLEIISVVVTTYNWPEALKLVLSSLARQDEKDFEVIVADDGSTDDTRSLIASVAQDYPVEILHAWQEDRGFRAAAARNLAVSRSKGRYIVFLDGDCLVRPDFISKHRLLAEQGWFVAGNRILLSQLFTKQLLQPEENIINWSVPEMILARIRGAINRWLPVLTFPDGSFRKLRRYNWKGAKTCNLGVWRDDFYLVNGFDESFTGWGHEDAEFVVRLINCGVGRKDGRFALPILHLWHSSQSREDEEVNLQKLYARIAGKSTRAEQGISAY